MPKLSGFKQHHLVSQIGPCVGVEWPRLGSAGWVYQYQLAWLGTCNRTEVSWLRLGSTGNTLIHPWGACLILETTRPVKLILFIVEAQESKQKHKALLRLKPRMGTPVTCTSSYWPKRSNGQTQAQGVKKYFLLCGDSESYGKESRWIGKV